jgi:hypothetical protein
VSSKRNSTQDWVTVIVVEIITAAKNWGSGPLGQPPEAAPGAGSAALGRRLEGKCFQSSERLRNRGVGGEKGLKPF